MKNSFYISENAAMLSMLDSGHQEQFKFFTEQTSVWFQNVMLRTLLQHKSNPQTNEDLSEDDIQVLTHSDQTMVLCALSVYGAARILVNTEGRSKKELEKNRPYSNDPQVDSMLLVLYNLIDLDIDELRHHSPVINDGDYSQEVLN